MRVGKTLQFEANKHLKLAAVATQLQLKDSVPDLVSFHREGIEFQTNTVAREPGVLEVTQLKSLDDTVHCSASEGDTLLYKVYVKGLKQSQEYANLKITVPTFYKWNFTNDSITPPTSWTGPYSYQRF